MLRKSDRIGSPPTARRLLEPVAGGGAISLSREKGFAGGAWSQTAGFGRLIRWGRLFERAASQDRRHALPKPGTTIVPNLL